MPSTVGEPGRRAYGACKSLFSAFSCFLFAILSLGVASPGHAQASICAEVKIQISQTVSLERQAFDAALIIRNGLAGVQIERLDVNLVFEHQAGGDAHQMFFSGSPVVTNIGGSIDDGTGTVAASTTGEAHWMIIPSAEAGGDSALGERYTVGATITYRMTGDTEDRIIEVIPETITVRPQPKLTLDYFLPGDVYADDPLTTEVEPVVPFTLGVRVANSGAGVAANTRIESAQPQIVENEQGLLIGFEIVGSFVDDQPSQPSLLIDFGDIEPNQSRMGRWIMTTTLSGQFAEFSAEYTHADELGGELTSLIDQVTAHRLTHDVLVDLDGRDEIRDFLAQAPGANPDTDLYHVYESDGATSAVITRFNPTLQGATLTFGALSQGLLAYVRAPITFDGQGHSITAVRSDGTEVPSANIWFSKRRDSSGEAWLYYVNLFEADSSTCGATCSYSLVYDGVPSPDASIAGLVYEDLDASGTQEAGEPGLDGVTVTLTDGTTPQNLVTGADGSFIFDDLPAGTYSLMVAAVSEHQDGAHTVGTAGGVVDGSSINGIALDSGVQAAGYLFAKVPTPPQIVADLGIGPWSASTTVPRVDDEFTVSVDVANAGPDTADGVLGIGLPPAIELVAATPSAGIFDPATLTWHTGSLAPSAVQTLTLELRAISDGSFSVTSAFESSDPNVIDPDLSDNTAALAINIALAIDVTVDAALVSESRLLVLVSCPGSRDVVACESSRSTLLRDYLDAASIEHVVTANPATFRDELRSGHWNVYWFDNGVAKLDDGQIAEVGMAVFRGDSLMIDGSPASDTVAAWAGVQYQGQRSTIAEEVSFVPNPYLAFTGLVVDGVKHNYTLTSGTGLAQYPDGAPAIVLATHGSGRVLTFAYGMLDSQTGNVAYADLFDQIMLTTRPDVSSFFTADSYVTAFMHLQNDGGQVTLDETVVAPVGATIVNSTPAVPISSGVQVVWHESVDVGASFDSWVGLRTQSNSTSSLLVDVTEAGNSSVAIAADEVQVTVRATAKLIKSIGTDIDSLPVSGNQDLKLREAAADAFAAARLSYDAGELNDALAHLIEVENALAKINSADTSAVRTDVAWLLQVFSRAWYLALPSCDIATPYPVANDGMSFVPFAVEQGLYLHQISPGGFEWRLGADTGSSHSVGHTENLANDQTYDWTLVYDGNGNGNLEIIGHDQHWKMQYMFTGTQKLHTGNGIRLSVEALGGPVQTSIDVATSALDGAVFSDAINATAAETTSAASLYYYGDTLEDGFSLSGNVNVSVPDWISKLPPRLSFRVNAGTISCKRAGY